MDADKFDSLLERAGRLLQEGKAAEALRLIDRIDGDALTGDDLIEFSSLRAWVLSELDRADEALELLQPLLEEYSESARLFGALGIVLSNAGDLEDAQEALQNALEFDPNDEILLANLALVHEKLQDYSRALELYDLAIEKGCDVDWVLQRKAAVQTEAGDYGAAKTSLRRYLSLVPEDPAQWISLAILHSDDEEFDAAFDCYRAAEHLDPESSALRLNWGVTAVRAGRLDAARQQLGRLEQLEPRSTRPLLLRAFILEEEGAMPAARALYERALAQLDGAEAREVAYALEMAMDFYARRKLVRQCRALLRRAYAQNACTVELCEAYREGVGDPTAKAAWFSVLIEADYRPGLVETYERDADPTESFARFERTYQVVARDRDEAVASVREFAARMGERRVNIVEIVGEEPIEDTPLGIYEVERESLVLA